VGSKLIFRSGVAPDHYFPQDAARVGSKADYFERAITWWTSLALMLTALLVPITVTAVPPLTDYPNHLARCYLLAFGQSDPVLSQMFFAHWQIIPNIAVDLILPALMHLFPPLAAGRVILALCLLLPTSGAVALSYAYFRRRSFWQLATGFAAFNALFLMGFMNFELAIGIAMWGAAAWIHYREKFPIAAVASGVVIATLVFFFHMFGFCFYALLIGSYELSVLVGKDFRSWPHARDAAKRVALLALALVVPTILYFASPLEKVEESARWPHLAQKAANFFAPFLDYSSAFGILTVIPLIAFLIYCVMQQRARISSAALMCFVILLATYIVMPRGMKGTFFLDIRLPVMLGFMLFAGFMPTNLSSRQKSAAILIFAALFVARIAFITDVWMHSQRDVEDVREVIASVTPGSRVLAADVVCADNWDWCGSMPISRRLPELTPTYWHLASFVLLDRHAFWPNIFAEDTKQPIRIKEPYRELQAVDSPPVNYLELASPSISPSELKRFPFLPHWNEKFDYVLVLNAEGAPDPEHFLPNRLQLVDRQGIAALFLVRK
jgi:MFS family permease